MADTVRQQIIDKVKARLVALSSSFAAVTLAGDQDQAFAAAVSGGKGAAEVIAGDDEPVLPFTTIDLFTFPLAVVIYLPSPLPGGATALKTAHELCRAVYGTYGTAELETFDGLARSARCTTFGGAVYVDEASGLSTWCGFDVSYGFRRGSPDVAA
jgi:hypothetical protein